MPAYLVGSSRVLDQARFDAYAEAAGPIVAKYGGKILASSPATGFHATGLRPEPIAT